VDFVLVVDKHQNFLQLLYFFQVVVLYKGIEKLFVVVFDLEFDGKGVGGSLKENF